MKIAAYGLALILPLSCGAKANGFLLRSSPRLAAEASSIRLSSMPGPVYAQIKGARARTAYCLRVRKGVKESSTCGFIDRLGCAN